MIFLTIAVVYTLKHKKTIVRATHDNLFVGKIIILLLVTFYKRKKKKTKQNKKQKNKNFKKKTREK